MIFACALSWWGQLKTVLEYVHKIKRPCHVKTQLVSVNSMHKVDYVYAE